jgi:clan AA aspartic protease (TIGR02281 family)
MDAFFCPCLQAIAPGNRDFHEKTSVRNGYHKWLMAVLAATLWLSLLVVAIAQPVDTQAPKTTVAVVEIRTSINTLLRAMQSGDAQTAVQLYQSSSDPIVHVWAAMVLERMRFNLDAASKDAETCQQALIDTRPGIALLCGQFESGNLRLAGHAKEANDKEHELIGRYQHRGIDDMVTQMQNYQSRQASVPAFNVERSNASTTLTLKEEATVPTFKAQANGHEFDLMLDTGASNVVLGEESARRYGVKLLDEFGHVSGWLSKDVPSQHGQLDTLQIGNITLKNVPVTVVPRPIALIGANLVASLGTLRITHSSLSIDDAAAPAPGCDTPMLVSTNLWGDSLRVIPQLLINDAPRSVMLDTGASRYLVGSQEALDEVTVLHRGKSSMRDVGGSHAFANVQRAKVKLTIAGQPFDMYFDVYSDSKGLYPITLGAGALRDMDFLLDFRHQHMCFMLHPNLH